MSELEPAQSPSTTVFTVTMKEGKEAADTPRPVTVSTPPLQHTDSPHRIDRASSPRQRFSDIYNDIDVGVVNGAVATLRTMLNTLREPNVTWPMAAKQLTEGAASVSALRKITMSFSKRIMRRPYVNPNPDNALGRNRRGMLYTVFNRPLKLLRVLAADAIARGRDNQWPMSTGVWLGKINNISEALCAMESL